MNKIYKNTIKIRNFLKPFIGDLDVKTYFSYYGLFKNNLMFGLYKDDKLYLKIPESFIKKYNILFPLNNDDILIRDFYLFPQELFNTIPQNNLLPNLISHLKQENRNNQVEKSIRHLPNMNMRLERLLQRNGIQTIDDLYKLGEIQTFVKLIKQGVDAASLLLFKLHGALNNQLVYTLKDQQKQDLLEEVDTALYDAGLRKRFTVNNKILRK